MAYRVVHVPGDLFGDARLLGVGRVAHPDVDDAAGVLFVEGHLQDVAVGEGQRKKNEPK